MSTRKFLSLFLPSKPKVISSPTIATTPRLKKARNETGSIGAVNSVLTDPLIRNAFLKSSINRGDHTTAIFILMMQQFKKSYDGLSQVKAYSIYDISIRIKNDNVSKKSVQVSGYQNLSGGNGGSHARIPSYMQTQSVEVQSYSGFLSNIAIPDEERVQIVRNLHDGRIKNAFDSAYATMCAELVPKEQVDTFINQILSGSSSFTPQGNCERYISQLASELKSVDFDTRAMGLYL